MSYEIVNEPRVLICGSRNLGNDLFILKDIDEYQKQKYFIYNALDNVFKERGWILEPDEYGNWLPNVVIIHGGAKGVDSIADEYAVINWCQLEEFKADWEKYGNKAGPIRNKQMLEEGKPDLVIAFYKNINNKSKGTLHMVKIAKKAGVEVLEFSYE